MRKVFFATPAFSGKVNVEYAISLAETYTLLSSKGIETQICIHSSGSLLVAERNRLNKSFLKTDCTHMLCVDSDLAWPAQAVPALLDYDVDFVAGSYPARGENIFLFRPEYLPNGAIVTNGNNLLKMNYIPAGFMLIKREVIEKLHEHFDCDYFKPKSKDQEEEDGFCIFNTEVRDGEFWGEDFVFCRKVRECGFDIWVDPMIEFNHAGTRGMMANCLTNDETKAKKGNVWHM
jgi:hypothetical protein